MTKFKVGDVVIGNEFASNEYSVTVKGWKGEVVDIDTQSKNNIFVRDFDTKEKYWVDSACFDMYKEAPKKEFKDLDDNERYWVNRKIFEDSKDIKGIVNVSVDFIKQAYQMADPDLRWVMEQEFEDLFKEDESAFEFGYEYTLKLPWSGPLMIGHGLAPKGLSGRCLVVRSAYDLEVVEQEDNKILIFREKK